KMDIVEIIILVIVGLFAFGTMAYLAYDVYKDDKEFKESNSKIILLPSFKKPVKKEKRFDALLKIF
ncbi:MAG TPA: hypothetical protein VK014_06860, partial [Cyclobacteriaceae bacterium]|nr:hypothetical protein [Cyclobacteriaceae bacterium]